MPTEKHQKQAREILPGDAERREEDRLALLQAKSLSVVIGMAGRVPMIGLMTESELSESTKVIASALESAYAEGKRDAAAITTALGPAPEPTTTEPR